MMRGVAEITLTDAATGEVERRVEENMVTNAVQDLVRLNPAGLKPSPVPWDLPLCPNAVGGVLLFDRAIEEDASSYFAPADAWPVGYASNNVDTSGNPLRGSYNASESGAVDGGYRLVFDFGTDRANGTIKSVCLTSSTGGRAYFGSAYLSGHNWNIYQKQATCGFSYAHSVNGLSALTSTHLLLGGLTGAKKARVSRLARSASKLRVADGYGWSGAFERSDFESEGSFSTTGCACFDDRYLYRWSWTAGSGKVRFFRARFDGEPREWTVSYDAALADPSYATVSCGYLYSWANDATKGVYRLSVDDPSDAAIVPGSDAITTSSGWKSDIAAPIEGYEMLYTGGYWIHGGGGVAKTYNSSGVPPHFGSCAGYPVSSPTAWRAGRAMRVGPYILRLFNSTGSSYKPLIDLSVATPYLATIDNLSSPVEKTSRHTMKIAYTLYDE